MNPRFVIDTNVIVKGLLSKTSYARLAIRKAKDIGIILVSQPIIDELRDVLSREKFNRYIALQERLEFLTTLLEFAEVVEPTITIDACRDPKDNRFLEVAISASVTCIISNDNDLLVLNPFEEIPILNAESFLNHDW